MRIRFHRNLTQNSGERDVRKKRLQIRPRTSIALDGVDPVRDFPNGLSVLLGNLNVPSAHVRLEALQGIRPLRKSLDVASRIWTYRESGRAADMNDVLRLSQHPRQRNLPGGGVVLLVYLLWTVRELEVGEVLLRAPRD